MTTAYEKARKWRLANPIAWKEHQRKYRDRHGDVIRASRKRYKETHKDKVKAGRLAARARIIEFIEDYKVSRGCVFCGENFPGALDFHHTGDKEANVSQISIRSWGLGRVQKEIDKCVLLCANCHRKLHAGFLSLD